MANFPIQDYADKAAPTALDKVFIISEDETTLGWVDPADLPAVLAAVAAAAAAQAAADAAATTANTKVAKAGDTMTGNLAIAKTTPTLTIDATGGTDSGTLIFKDGGVTRWALDRRGVDGNLIFRRYDAAGGVQSDVLQLNVDGSVNMMTAAKVDIPTPATSTNAATKGYVDTAVGGRVSDAGDTMTGDLAIAKTTPAITLNATGTSDNGDLKFANGGVVQFSLQYRGDAGSFDLVAHDPVTGAVFSTAITVAADGSVQFPGAVHVSEPFEADSPVPLSMWQQHNTALGNKVTKTGDTMTGNLTVPTPTAPGHAATKAYVDANAGGGGGPTGVPPMPFQTGAWYAAPMAATGSAPVSAGTLVVLPFEMEAAVTIAELGVNTTTFSAPAVVHVVVYDSHPTTGMPNNQLFAGLIDVSATAGWKSAVPGAALALAVGRYWMGVCVVGASITFSGQGPHQDKMFMPDFSATGAFLATNAAAGYRYTSMTAPPATLPAVPTNIGSTTPRVVFKAG